METSFRQTVYILYFLVLICLLTLLGGCSRSSHQIPESTYDPHILKPSKYIKTQGRVINMDSVKKPTRVPIQSQFIQGEPPQRFPLTSNYQKVAPQYVPSQREIVDMDSLVKPQYFPANPKRIPGTLPQWHPAQIQYEDNSLLSYLNVEQGLLSPNITEMMMDHFGRIWIGYYTGDLSVWDGVGFTHFIQFGEMNSHDTYNLFEDSKGNIWICTRGGGIYMWDGTAFTYFSQKEGLSDNFAGSVVEDQDGQIWIGGRYGLNVWDGNRFIRYFNTAGMLGQQGIRMLMKDQKGHIWIATMGNGVYVWDGNAFIHYSKKNGLVGNLVFNILEDREGKVWIGTFDNGISVWDGKGFVNYKRAEELKDHSVMSLFEDRHGNIWVGYRNGGISIWNEEGFWNIADKEVFDGHSISHLLEDRTNRIWVATRGKGINILTRNHFTYDSQIAKIGIENVFYLSTNGNKNIWIGTKNNDLFSLTGEDILHYSKAQGINDGNIQSLMQDLSGRIWIGTTGKGVKVWDPTFPNGITHYPLSIHDGSIIHDVRSIVEDHKGRIWTGSLGDGIRFMNLFEVESDRHYLHYTTEQGLSSNEVLCLLEDKNGHIWIGTKDGLNVWNPFGKGEFTHFTSTEGLNSDGILSLLEDHIGRIWIGTKGGINVWDGNVFFHYTQNDGLSNNNINSLVQDKNGNIWVGTNNGLNQLSPTENENEWKIRKFFKADGLMESSIVDMALDSSTNKLWVASAESLGYLDLNQLKPDSSRPIIFLRELQPFFESLDWRRIADNIGKGIDLRIGENSISAKGVTFDSVLAHKNLPINLALPYDINDLTFRWSATAGTAPGQTLYSYMLEGNDQDWSPPISQHEVRIQNLSPGDYTFKVRAVGGNGQWSETASYAFSIRPPWWQTWWAYTLYTLAIAGLLYALYRYQFNRQLEAQEARRIKELDQFKTRFFTNITHEFRTPLTVIMGMAAQIQDHFQQKNLIQRNSQQLLRLINQLLDLSKLEAKALKPQYVQTDILQHIDYIVSLFESYADSKEIQLTFEHESSELIMDFDPERLQDILSNLISNALKFTPKGGEVQLAVSSGQFSVNREQLAVGKKALNLLPTAYC